MTQEQIKNLAREYAESVSPIESYGDDIVERRMNGIIEYGTAIPVLQWLSERYAIVDKSNLSQLVRHLRNMQLAYSHIPFAAIACMLADLFGDDIIQELLKDKQ